MNETDRELLPPTDLVERAHDHGLLIHTWTFRNEQRRLASDYGGNPISEYLLFYELGVDGLFSDFPTRVHSTGAVQAGVAGREDPTTSPSAGACARSLLLGNEGPRSFVEKRLLELGFEVRSVDRRRSPPCSPC